MGCLLPATTLGQEKDTLRAYYKTGLRFGTADRVFQLQIGGSGGVHPSNLNATPAIVPSAVLYVLRLLIDRPLPLNEGLLRAVSIHIPPGLLDPPFPDDPARAPAVVGGNVETSQRLVDTLLKALGLAACSQGTMNNLVFGNEHFGYYETIAGGAGATPDAAGACGVHTHMTNSRLTDPEILELRHPVHVVIVRHDRAAQGLGKLDQLVIDLVGIRCIHVCDANGHHRLLFEPVQHVQAPSSPVASQGIRRVGDML